MPGGDIEHDSIGPLPAFVNQGLQIGSIRVYRQNAAGAEVQKEEPTRRERAFRFGSLWRGSYCVHVKNLLACVSMLSRVSLEYVGTRLISGLKDVNS